MSTKALMSKCPYNEGTASRKVYAALARAGKKGLTPAEVCRFAHIQADKARTLLTAYKFPSHHCSSLTRVGIRLIKEDDRYRLDLCKADPSAHRPAPKSDE